MAQYIHDDSTDTSWFTPEVRDNITNWSDRMIEYMRTSLSPQYLRDVHGSLYGRLTYDIQRCNPKRKGKSSAPRYTTQYARDEQYDPDEAVMLWRPWVHLSHWTITDQVATAHVDLQLLDPTVPLMRRYIRRISAEIKQTEQWRFTRDGRLEIIPDTSEYAIRPIEWLLEHLDTNEPPEMLKQYDTSGAYIYPRLCGIASMRRWLYGWTAFIKLSHFVQLYESGLFDTLESFGWERSVPQLMQSDTLACDGSAVFTIVPLALKVRVNKLYLQCRYSATNRIESILRHNNAEEHWRSHQVGVRNADLIESPSVLLRIERINAWWSDVLRQVESICDEVDRV